MIHPPVSSNTRCHHPHSLRAVCIITQLKARTTTVSQQVMIWGAMPSAAWSTLCFQKSILNAAIYHEILEHFILPAAEKLFADTDFIFQQDLAPARTAKGTKSWGSMTRVLVVLNWSAELKPIENLKGAVKKKMRNARPNNAADLKAAFKATSASIAPLPHLITSFPPHLNAAFHTKGDPTNY